MVGIILFTSLLTPFLIFCNVILAQTTPENLLNWTYRKPIYINVSQNATEQNFQVRLNVSFEQDKMNVDFSDLRFTDNSGSPVDHWDEFVSNSSYDQVWIEVPTNITTENTTIFMYYGNSDATESGNILDTFVFADNFTRADSSTVGANWTEYNSDWGIRSNRLETGMTNDTYYAYVLADGIGQFVNISVRAVLNISSWDKVDNAGGVMLRSNQLTGGNHYSYTFLLEKGATPACAIYNVDIAAGNKSATSGWVLNQAWWFETAVSGNTVLGKCWKDGTAEPSNWTNIQTFTTQATGYVGINGMNWYDKSVKTFITNFTVRRFWNWEPMISFGQEETYANESQGDAAIIQGIQNALEPNVAIYPNQTIYIRYPNESQFPSIQFDAIAISGNQTWAFNYITQNETYTNMNNLSTNVYVWEESNLRILDIRNQVSNLINTTKKRNDIYEQLPGSFFVLTENSLNFYY